MKPKQTLILGAAVALIIAGIVLYHVVYEPRQQASRQALLSAFPDLDPAKVAAIEIQKGGYAVKLNKKGDHWVVASEGDYPADSEGVTQMMETAKALRLSDLASNKAKTHELFEVADDQGLKVNFLDPAGKPLAQMIVGKRGDNYGTAYVRRAGEDSTYLVGQNLTSIFDRSKDTWKDKSIARFEVSEPTELVIKGDQETLTLRKAADKGAWELIEGETETPANQSVVEGILRGFGTIRTLEFPTVDLKAAGLDSSGRSVSVKLQAKTEITLQIGKLDSANNRYYLKRADQPTVFLAAKYQVDSLFKTKDELLTKAENPEPSSPLPPPDLKK
jgi:hypothetical protein